MVDVFLSNIFVRSTDPVSVLHAPALLFICFRFHSDAQLFAMKRFRADV